MSYSARAYYLAEHGTDPVMVRTPEDIDDLIDDLLAQPATNNFATLYVNERSPNQRGFPDHELCVAVDSRAGAGALMYMGTQGHWASEGTAAGREDVHYSYVGNIREFPPRSEIPLDLVRRAAKEFLSNGGERPTAVQWQDSG